MGKYSELDLQWSQAAGGAAGQGTRELGQLDLSEVDTLHLGPGSLASGTDHIATWHSFCHC